MHQYRKRLGKFTLLFVLVGVCVSSLSVGVFYLEYASLQDNITSEKSEYVLSHRKNNLKLVIANNKLLLYAIRNNYYFNQYLHKKDNHNYKNVLELFNTLSLTNNNIMQLRYIDEFGKENIRLNRQDIGEKPFLTPSNKLQDKSKRDYFIQTKDNQSDQIYISNIDLNIEYEKVEVPYKPVIRIAIPIFLKNKFKGIIVVNVFMKHIIKKLVNSDRFYMYLFDKKNCLLYSNNKDMINWSFYKNAQCSVNKNDFINHKLILHVSSSNDILLGIQTKQNILLKLTNLSNAIILTILIIIAISFIMAYFLVKIPEHIYNKLENDQAKLLQQSKLASMGEMLTMIAHQWRQPLSSISSTANNLLLKVRLNKFDKDLFLNELNLLDSYSQHLSETINDFRDFFKISKEKKMINLHMLLKDTCNIALPNLKDENIKLEILCDNRYELYIYPNEIKHVLLNIIKNSEDVFEERSIENAKITIECYEEDSDIVIILRDNGGGIDDSILDKIFEPYFSTKYDKNGTGLGLYMSKMIIDEHSDGKLSVSNDGLGARFKIVFYNQL